MVLICAVSAVGKVRKYRVGGCEGEVTSSVLSQGLRNGNTILVRKPG